MTAANKNSTEKTQKATVGGSKLSGLLKPAQQAESGKPLMLDMALIDEDPAQPRTEENPGFSKESIAEIGGTIKGRGVKTPISVRENPEVPGRYLINDGARRYRGSKWAGKTTIPAFVDNDYVSDDQVVANIQREGHTPWELAKLIEKCVASGMKKIDIAKAWGVSPAYITQYAALLDLPPAISEAFTSGRLNDVTLVSELLKAHKSKPQEVADWLANDAQEITRGSVKLLREFLEEEPSRDPGTVDAFTGQTDAEGGGTGGATAGGEGDEGEKGGEGNTPGAGGKRKEQDPTKLRKAIVQVEINGNLCRLLMTERPSEVGLAWFKNEVSGEEFEAELSKAVMTALVEG